MFLSVVYFMTGLLGFLTSTVVVSQYKTNRKVNFYLIILIFSASVRFFLNGIHTLISFSFNEELIILFRSFGCAVFACVYLYFKCLIVNRKSPVLKDLYHFIIPVLFGFSNLLIRKYANHLNLYSYIFFSLIPLFYLLLSYLELQKKVWSGKSRTAFGEKQRVFIKNWTIFFFLFCTLGTARLVITLFFDVYVAGFSDGSRYLWISAILCCVLFFKLLFTPMMLYSNVLLDYEVKSEEYFELVFEDFWLDESEVLITNSQDLKLSERVESDLESYIYEIERMALEHFCFRNPKVSMRDFAIRLEIPKSHLLYFFNTIPR